MGRLIWGVLLVVAGALFLAINAGWADWGFVFSLLQLWPLVLVAVGIDLILGRRNRGLATGLIVIVLLAGLAVAWVSWDGEGGTWFGAGPLTTHQITRTPTGPVRSGHAGLDTGAAQIQIHALTPVTGRAVVGGSYQTRGEPRITDSTANGVYSLEIGREGRFGSWPWGGGSSGRERLDLGLSPGIPWTLDLNLGATSAEIDLSQVLLEELTLDAGASSVGLTVGDVTPNAHIDLQGGAGSYRVTLPRGRRVELELQSSLSSRNLDPAFESTGDQTWVAPGAEPAIALSIDASVSSVRVELR